MRLLVLVLVLLLTGCGIPIESTSRPLPTGTAAPVAPPDGGGGETPLDERVTLWFVRGGLLVPAIRTTTAPVTPQALLDLLAQGPTPAEEAAGIRSAVVSVVSGQPLVVTAREAGVEVNGEPGDEVAVVLKPEFTDLLAQEQVLVLGEVVTTLAVGDVRQVLFVDDDGQTLGVPTADGRLANGPVSPADYAMLVG